MHTKNNLKQFI